MCGISGFCNYQRDYTEQEEHFSEILEQMHQVQSRRGPDGHGSFLAPHIGLSHARLSIIDLTTGGQPMTRTIGKYTWAIVQIGRAHV